MAKTVKKSSSLSMSDSKGQAAGDDGSNEFYGVVSLRARREAAFQSQSEYTSEKHKCVCMVPDSWYLYRDKGILLLQKSAYSHPVSVRDRIAVRLSDEKKYEVWVVKRIVPLHPSCRLLAAFLSQELEVVYAKTFEFPEGMN